MRNLILVHQPGRQDAQDFQEIAQYIRQLKKDVKPVIVSARFTADAIPAAMWANPTLTVCFGPLGQFVPKRGPVFRNQRLDKAEELRAMDRYGIPVPRWQIYTPGLELDPADWGPAVVLKPVQPEFKAVSLMPTGGIRTLELGHLPEEHPYRKSPIIIQKFIDTGRHATATRVLTLFGEPIHCLRSTLKQPRPELDQLESEISPAIIATNQKTEGSAFELREIALVNDERAIALARERMKAFPGLPLQGVNRA